MGHTSYCPIPFAKSCKVTIDPEDDYLYYQINYDLYPPGTHAESFNPATDLDTPEIKKVQAIIEDWNQGKPLIPWDGDATTEYDLGRNEAIDLFSREGAGVVRGIRITLPRNMSVHELLHAMENVWLIVHVDDDEPRDASVRAPVGPMFLDYGPEHKPRSFFIGTDSEGAYYSFFPMP